MITIDMLLLSGTHPRTLIDRLNQDANFRSQAVGDVRLKYGKKVSEFTDEKILSIQINSLYHLISVKELVDGLEEACVNFLKKEKALHSADEETPALRSSSSAAVNAFALLVKRLAQADIEKGYDNLIEILTETKNKTH